MTDGRTIRPLSIVAGALLGAALATSVFADECVNATPEVSAMARGILVVGDSENTGIELDVLIADSRDERAAGFQYLCPDVFEDTAILFVFDSDSHSAFHMFNVQGPLDIAFIGADRTVVDVLRMEPYGDDPTQHVLYGTPHPFRYALETAAGRMEVLGISPGTTVTLP